MLLGLVVRVLSLYFSNFGVESDEAIVGLMAKHMTEGRSWPVFYYGQDYMGSFEAILVSLVFALFGQSNAALKAVPTVFSLFHIALVYVLARRFVRPAFARIAALLTALGPSVLILWSHKARGGFIELVVLGTLALIMAVDILRRERNSGFSLFLLGAVLGLGWWVNNQMVFYILPIGTIFLFSFLQRYGLRQSVVSGTSCIVGFFLGGLPFWYANLLGDPPFATFKVLFGKTAEGHLLEYLQGFFTTALPIVFGARRFWSEIDVFSSASLLLFAGYLLVFVAAIALPRRATAKLPGANYSFMLLLLFCLAVPMIFSASSFGWLSKAPRYLLPLYSILFVIVAIAVEKLWDREFVGSKAVAVGILSIISFSHIASNYHGGVSAAGQPFVYRGDRVSSSHQELYDWLAKEGYTHIHTNYWIAYRTAFETQERVTATLHGSPRFTRIPEYERNAKIANLPIVYVLVAAEAGQVGFQLQQFGYKYRSTWVGDYVVLDKIQPAWPRGEAVAIEESQVTATSRPEQVGLMFDGDLDTRWGSGKPQHPGMRIDVDFPTAKRITGVELEFGAFLHDAPRNLQIIGTKADGSTVSLFSMEQTRVYHDLMSQASSKADPMWNIHFAPTEVVKLSFLQHGTTTVFDWSIAELRLFQAP